MHKCKLKINFQQESLNLQTLLTWENSAIGCKII